MALYFLPFSSNYFLSSLWFCVWDMNYGEMFFKNFQIFRVFLNSLLLLISHLILLRSLNTLYKYKGQLFKVIDNVIYILFLLSTTSCLWTTDGGIKFVLMKLSISPFNSISYILRFCYYSQSNYFFVMSSPFYFYSMGSVFYLFPLCFYS